MASAGVVAAPSGVESTEGGGGVGTVMAGGIFGDVATDAVHARTVMTFLL